MARKIYGGKIEFPNDYNRSFAEFKEDFADNWVFLAIPPEKRHEELKKAYKIATSNNGQFQSTIKESKETDSNETE